MRLRSACATVVAVVTVIGGLSVIPARATETTTDKPSVQPPADKALVYFVRPKRVGSRLSTFLYIDDDFVGALEDNSFTYAFVEEGRHSLWTFLTVAVKSRLLKAMSNSMLQRPWEGSEFKVVRGGTYYFRFRDPDGSRDTHVLLDESEGARLIDKVKFYSTPSSKEAQSSAIHLANRSHDVVWQFESQYAEIPDYPTPQVPLDQTGLIRVDSNTEVSLELVQNVTAYRDSTGDEVWFRVTRDSASAEGVWLREGTLVRGILYHAKGRVLDVVIPAVVAVDGTVVPTLGAIQEQGGKHSKAGRVAWNLLRALSIIGGGDLGPLGGGKSAYLLSGSTTTIYTRDPVWIARVGTTIESNEQESGTPALRLRVSKSVPVRFVPRKRHWPNYLEFLLEHPQRPVALRLRSIAGQPPPAKIETRWCPKVRRGWLCIFDGWQLVRFLPVDDQRSHIALEFDGVFEDGAAFVVEAAIDMEVY